MEVECRAALASVRSGVEGMQATGQSAASALKDSLATLLEDEGRQLDMVFETFSTNVGSMTTEGGAAAERVGKEMCARLSKEVVQVRVHRTPLLSFHSRWMVPVV